MLNLDGSPYSLDIHVQQKILMAIKDLEERVNLLRRQGILTIETLHSYYGAKRYEQVAESNALEGSTLDVGETELAVLRGITITGHDPGFIRDAISLNTALQRLLELSRDNTPTDIKQVKEIHELILGDRPSAGVFRKERVRIKGSKHTPPRTWEEVMENMEHWEVWSIKNSELPAIIRATVLHAWCVHIHPFIDGNGRTARAITNLELVRAGYPPIIIRKKERDRYIDALGASDEAGDLIAFFELIILRARDALYGLENAAKAAQGYSPAQERIRLAQERTLDIWLTSVSLLVKIIENELGMLLEPVGGQLQIKIFENALELDDYISLCDRQRVEKTWSFILNVQIPGHQPVIKLAWYQFRSQQMLNHLQKRDGGGPALFWSIKNPDGYPSWRQDNTKAPKYIEMTTVQGMGDEWHVMDTAGNIKKINTTALAKEIANKFLEDATA